MIDRSSARMQMKAPRRAVSALGLVVLAGCLVGCADDELPLPPVVWEGSSVRIRMDDPGIQVCGGSFEALDRHAELVREALLLEGDEIIDYSIGDESFVESVCATPSSRTPQGCAYPGLGWVYTSVPYVPHELVHATRMKDPQLRFLSSPIEEGLATLFGADWVGDETVRLDAQEILEDPLVSGLPEYHRAGQTMATLLDAYGREEFRRFDVLARTAGEDRAFEEVFGETKEEFAAFAEVAPQCGQSQWWMPLLECDGEPGTADPGTGAITLGGNVRCDEPDVQGPDFGRMWTSRHFRLDHTTTIASYDVEMPEDATLEIVGCDGGCPGRVAYLGEIDDIGTFGGGIPALQAGDYFLRVSRPLGSADGGFEVIIH